MFGQLTRLAAAGATLLVFATPVFAHQGVLHEGCPIGQSFTAGDITVSGAFTRATPPNAQSAGGYFTIANAGTSDDTLLGVTTEAAKSTGLHDMKMNGQVMEMKEVEGGVVVPAGGSVSFAPMGYHLMMTGLPQEFHAGECVAVTLHFARAGDIAVTLNVGGFAQQTPPTSSDAPAAAMDMSAMDMSGMDMSSSAPAN